MHSTANPEKEAFSRELRVILEEAVDALPDGTREVFMLRQVEGLSTADTAACLSVSEDVVKTRLSRARAALRQNLFDRMGATAASSFTFQRPRCDRIVAAVLARIA
jgi:RNA polymerase sigma-70 factor (ECF subfamily)